VVETQAQRLHRKAQTLRDERAARARENSPEDGADVGESPVIDDADRIARTEALSAMVTPDDQKGLGMPEPGGYEEQVKELGAELAEQVDTRVQDWLDGAEQKFDAMIEGLDKTKPNSFVYGAIFGAIALAVGVFLGGRHQNR
jgi:hypothetical protein